MKSNLGKWLGGLIIVIIIVIIATTAGNSKKENGAALQIGLIYGITGPAATWTENAVKAAELATDEINSSGGVNGKKISLMIEDSKSDPKGSVSAFQKLTTVDHVGIIVGDAWSVMTNPLIPLADSKKVLVISPTVMDSSVAGQSPYFFTLGHTVASQEQSFEKFFSANPDVKTIYNLCWNDEWGKAHTALLHQVTAKLGVKIIGESCTADYGNDYRTEGAKVKEANPDAVFITSSYEERAIKVLTDLHIKAKILTTNGIGLAIKVNKFPIEYMKNVWFTDWVPEQSFIDKFEAKYGAYPIQEAQNSYETMRSIAKALTNDPNDILNGLKSVKYASVDGSIDFTDSDHITMNKAEAKLYRADSSGSFVEVK